MQPIIEKSRSSLSNIVVVGKEENCESTPTGETETRFKLLYMKICKNVEQQEAQDICENVTNEPKT